MELRLDSPLPAAISIGGGTALFVCGACYDQGAPMRGLSFVVDGEEQPVLAHGMPRPDLGTNGGFWGIACIAPRDSTGDSELQLRAHLPDGRSCTRSLASIAVDSAPEPVAIAPPRTDRGPLVAICMATYDPPLELFRRQIESIRAQTHGDWVCVVSDDCSRPDRFAAIRDFLGDDPRFVLSRSPRHLGFYSNFERALEMAPAQARYVAFADQDDFWYPDKLSILIDRIRDAQLVYSDARIIGRGGEVMHDSYWSRRRNEHRDLISLLVANAVTGAASLFRRELLAYALPFPPAQFTHYHDHWVALVALACGGIEFVPKPLYDYVQHPEATLGHAAATRAKRLRERLHSLRGGGRVRVARTRYFVDFARLMTFATILEMRCGERMTARARSALGEFVALERSWPALTKFGWRAVRELTGTPTTLGAEWALFQALAWRRALGIHAPRGLGRRLRMDAVPPADFAPRPQP